MGNVRLLAVAYTINSRNGQLTTVGVALRKVSALHSQENSSTAEYSCSTAVRSTSRVV